MPNDVAVLYPLDSNPTRRKLGSTCWDWLGLSIGDVTGLLDKPKPTTLRVSQPAPMPGYRVRDIRKRMGPPSISLA